MSDNTADLAGAIEALSSALESMERRQGDLATQVSAAKQRRRERLDQLVATLLPDISVLTMERLMQEATSFAVDRKVMDTFEQNLKILWLFKPHGYDAALTLLQAQLKLYLERQGVVREEDQDITQLESEKATLATQQSEALEMLWLMEKVHRTNTTLPPETVSSINSLAQRGRNLNGARQISRPLVGTSRFAGSQPSTVQASSESNMDLWLWMMTDIPTSFRTLMLNSFSHHHDSNSSPLAPNTITAGNGELGGAGASGEFTQMDGQTMEQNTAIATDDSLGMFS